MWETAPGFKPWNWNVIYPGFKVCFQIPKLYRYGVMRAQQVEKEEVLLEKARDAAAVGLCTLNQVDP
jgi:hypothetical protein